MFLGPWATVALLLGMTNLAVSQGSLGLIDTLMASGASKFASLIQSDPDVLQLYLSGQIRTVFAPCDCVSDNITLEERKLSPKGHQRAAFQAAKDETSLAMSKQSLPGSTLETADQTPLLEGRGQRVVIDTRPVNVTGPTKRWHTPLASRQESDKAAQSLLRITSGLGNTTNVVRGDIPYDGGLIHITDSYFTLPQPVSSTSQATGQTSFAGLLAKSNMTNTLESTHSVTIFLPSNAAFSSTNTSVPATELLSNHVVAGTVSYLPDLTDGSCLTTTRGELLTVSVREGQYYVNGARITKANLVLENGVAHVIDKVLVPKLPTPVTGGSSPKKIGLGSALGVVASLVLLALV